MRVPIPSALHSPVFSYLKKNDLLQAGELYFGFNILESYIKFYLPTQFHKKEKAWDMYKKNQRPQWQRFNNGLPKNQLSQKAIDYHCLLNCRASWRIQPFICTHSKNFWTEENLCLQHTSAQFYLLLLWGTETCCCYYYSFCLCTEHLLCVASNHTSLTSFSNHSYSE